MREGQNPAKFVQQIAKPEKITVAVLAHIPFQSGFYAHTLDVLKECLGSLWRNTDIPHDLLVFDNGSCREAVDFLREAHQDGRIQFLVLSEQNLGKGGAWNFIFQFAPGDVLAYADSDVYFHPGWLDEALEILETFPDVGMVTSRPFRTSPELYSSTLKWAEKAQGVSLEEGQFVPWETFREFDMSLGQDEEHIRERYEQTFDLRVTYQDVTAHIGASHWQFVGYTSTLRGFLPLEMDRPMGQVRMLDQKVNDGGHLRLMTSRPLTMNMSNTLAPIPAPNSGKHTGTKTPSLKKRVLEFPLLKRGLLFIYDWIFRRYYGR